MPVPTCSTQFKEKEKPPVVPSVIRLGGFQDCAWRSEVVRSVACPQAGGCGEHGWRGAREWVQACGRGSVISPSEDLFLVPKAV